MVQHLCVGNTKPRHLTLLIYPCFPIQLFVLGVLFSILGIDEELTIFLQFIFLHNKTFGTSSRNELHFPFQTFKSFSQHRDTSPCPHFLRTGKNIHSCITEFRPSVHSHMWLSNHNHSTHAERFKMMEFWTNNCGITDFSTVKECSFNLWWAIQLFWRTVIKFGNEMFAEEEGVLWIHVR